MQDEYQAQDLPADGVPPQAEEGWHARRQRAVDLFSPHTYRALQLTLFERKAARAAAHADGAAGEYPHGADYADAPVHAAYGDGAWVGAPGYEDQAGVQHGSESAGPDSWYGTVASEPDPANASLAASDAGEVPAQAPAGRNMRLATIVGSALLILAVVGAWVHPIVFGVLLYLFAGAAVVEWKRALERQGRHAPLVPLLAATAGMGVAAWFAKPEGLVVALLVGCAGVVAWRIGDEREHNTLADALAGVLTLLWIPFLASFLFLLELADDGWIRVIIIVLAVVGNDTGGLIAGMRFGKHKLLPRVSPAKTWEGAIGGVLLGSLAATAAAYFFFDGKWYIGLAVGAAAAVAAIVGDLAESTLKRDLRVKDMSSAIPGHGGVLDRVDSLLFAAPVGYVVFAIFLGTLGGGGL